MHGDRLLLATLALGMAAACSSPGATGAPDLAEQPGDSAVGPPADSGAGAMPDLLPPPSDPFDPASCPGAPLSVADISARFFPAGKTSATLGSYTWVPRQRSCNNVSGCTAWGPPSGQVVGLYAGTRLTGSAGVSISNGTITLAFNSDKVSIGPPPLAYYWLYVVCGSLGVMSPTLCAPMGALYQAPNGTTTSSDLVPTGTHVPSFIFSGLFAATCLDLVASDRNGDANNWVETQLAVLMRY